MYKIDISVNEWWDEYAKTRHKSWADQIAAMLLARGEIVRISEEISDIRFGETQYPEVKNIKPISMEINA